MGFLKRIFQRLFEKLAGEYYEGPKLPDRYEAMIGEFMERHPQATRLDWAKYTHEMCRIAYESGYVRGFERSERDFQYPETAPEILADAEDPGWRDRLYDWRTGEVTQLGEVQGAKEAPLQEYTDYDPLEARRLYTRELARVNKGRPIFKA